MQKGTPEYQKLLQLHSQLGQELAADAPNWTNIVKLLITILTVLLPLIP